MRLNFTLRNSCLVGVRPSLGVIVFYLLIITGSLIPTSALAQRKVIQFTLQTVEDSTVVLSDNFIDSRTIDLVLDSTIHLIRGKDYSVDPSNSIIHFTPQLLATFFSIPSGGTGFAPSRKLTVTYQIIPIHLKKNYNLYERASDSANINTTLVADPMIKYSANPPIHGQEKAFNLTKAGGITRGIQTGSSQDLTFTNSFNFTFSGDLGNELSFKGALSEESTPIQPEGNTQTLRDIDRIYIEMNAGKIFSATLGDFVLDLTPRKIWKTNHNDDLDPIFNKFSRKVLGAKASFEYGPTLLNVSASATKGKYTTYAVQGIDAVQGPYRLQGKNGERDIIVIAGTENIYINGVQLNRGELNDYVIDYGLAEIRFTNKQIITNNSRITVEFQYTNEQYSRSLIAASQSTGLFSDDLTFSTSYIREGDDKDSPRNLSLSDSDKIILRNAGNDLSKASKSGVLVVGRDSSGRARGNYSRIDTIVHGKSVVIYRYSPFDTNNSIYNIGFGYIGAAKGNYIRKAFGEFQFVGVGLGDYDTVIYLPLPQLVQVLTGQLTYTPNSAIAFTGEIAASELDPNRFTPQDQITGKSYRFWGSYLDTLQTAILGATFQERFAGENYNPIERDRKVEELRNYGVESNAGTTAIILGSERERKATARLGLQQLSVVDFDYGLYSRGDHRYNAERFGGAFTLQEDSIFRPELHIRASHISTSDSLTAIGATWKSYGAILRKHFINEAIKWSPQIEYITENKSSHLIGRDSLNSEAFRYSQLTPSIDTRFGEKIALAGSVQLRKDDSTRNGIFSEISRSSTYKLNASIINLAGFSSLLDIGYRIKKYSDTAARTLNGGDISNLLLRIIPRYQSTNNILSFEGSYEASEQRAARSQRVFFPVQKGLGNYKYLGDINKNGKRDAEEYAVASYSDEGQYILITLPTETLFPVTDLRSSFRLRFNPLPFLGSETAIRVEENSTDEHSSDIYLYKLSHFLSDSTTIRGMIETQQDILFLENDLAQNYRLRFLERRNATQYNTGLERTYYREFAVRGKYHLSTEVSNETNIRQIIDRAVTGEHSTNRPHSTVRYGITTDWTYEPLAEAFGFGLRGELYVGSDNSFSSTIKSISNELSLSARYSLTSGTRLRSEIGRTELTSNGAPNIFDIPFSLTDGRSLGITWLWSLSLDTQISSGIVVSASYNGRSALTDGTNRSTIHNARAEVRASF